MTDRPDQIVLHLVPRDSSYLDVMVIEIKDADGNLIEVRVSEPELCDFIDEAYTNAPLEADDAV